MGRALAILALFVSAVACRAPADPAGTELDWMLGDWSGVRTDGAEGDAAPMTMRVEPVLAGAGQCFHVAIEHGGGVYRGFAVQAYDRERACWVRQYVNDTRGTFAGLEGEAGERRCVWRGASPERTRESRVVSELVKAKLQA